MAAPSDVYACFFAFKRALVIEKLNVWRRRQADRCKEREGGLREARGRVIRRDPFVFYLQSCISDCCVAARGLG